MYYTTQDNQEKRIKSLADLFLIINKLNLKDKSMQKAKNIQDKFDVELEQYFDANISIQGVRYRVCIR